MHITKSLSLVSEGVGLFAFLAALALRRRLARNAKSPANARLFVMAESEGFEPPVPRGTTVFKTAAIDHSANSPRQK